MQKTFTEVICVKRFPPRPAT